MEKILIPKPLNYKSRLAIISPSNGLPHQFPGIYELGLENLRELLGYEIVEFPTARMTQQELYNNPELRADDINRAFKDTSIDGIICSIGGYESIRILKYLDVKTILKNPKVIMGFSDATTFLTYLNYCGLVTFYGPSVMAGFAQLKNLPVECTEHIREMLHSPIVPYKYAPYKMWTNGYKDWSDASMLGQCTEFYENTGFKLLQGKKSAEGQLWGGCIEALEFLKSTDYWPDKSFWNKKILFFETSEEKPLPDKVGYMLRNYGIQGIFDKISGILFARPKDYSKEETDELYDIILKIVRDEFHAQDLPIVVGMDFGHTDPKFVLPMGCNVSIDLENICVTLLENPFE